MSNPVPGALITAYLWLGVFETVTTVPALKERSNKTKNVVVAFIHDMGALLLPLMLLFSENLHVQIAGPNTPQQLAVLHNSLGYFLADGAFWIIEARNGSKVNTRMLAHHTLCVTGIVACWIGGRGAGDLHLGMILTHISSPFGYARYFAKELGQEHHTYARVCGRLYLVFKLIAILLLSPPVVFFMVASRDNILAVKIAAIGILVVNLLWLHTTAKHRDYTL
jgi:hypothetical protein